MKGVKKIFGGGKKQAPVPPPPGEIQTFAKFASDNIAQLLARRGMGTSILTSEGGLPNLGTTKKPEIRGM